jgi:hypothetical protein
MSKIGWGIGEMVGGGYLQFIGGGTMEGEGVLLMVTPGGQTFVIPVAAVGAAVQADGLAAVAAGSMTLNDVLQMASQDKGSGTHQDRQKRGKIHRTKSAA